MNDNTVWEEWAPRPDVPIGFTVGFSNRSAAAAMTEALIGQGYQNIAFLGESGDDWTRGGRRRARFRDAIGKAGFSVHRILQTGKPSMSIEDGAEALPILLDHFPNKDAILCL